MIPFVRSTIVLTFLCRPHTYRHYFQSDYRTGSVLGNRFIRFQISPRTHRPITA
jgi:hypothetical protein